MRKNSRRRQLVEYVSSRQIINKTKQPTLSRCEALGLSKSTLFYKQLDESVLI